MQLPGMSGHADKNGLIEWLQNIGDMPAKVFVVHGEDSVTKVFSECLISEYGYDAYAPYSGTSYDLIADALIYEATPVPVAKKPKASRATEVFQRLVSAGKRLLEVIYKNEGVANKDLIKFCDQINSLADKWDREI